MFNSVEREHQTNNINRIRFVPGVSEMIYIVVIARNKSVAPTVRILEW